jgi:ribose transport system ATP-binding protein
LGNTTAPGAAGGGVAGYVGPALRMRGIVKSFSGVTVLRGVDLAVDAGEVLGLVGENGAGKSTLIKILTGLYTADAGEIVFHGEAVAITNPADAERLGIHVIHQDRHFAGRLTVAEHLYLGHSEGGGSADGAGRGLRGLFVSRRELHQRAGAELRRSVGLDVDTSLLVDDLTVAEQQLLQIARAVLTRPRLLVLDEPTAPLAAAEVERLFATVRSLQAQGIPIIYISHYLQEVQQIARRVTVLRNGANAGELDLSEPGVDLGDVVELMVGRGVDEFTVHTQRVVADGTAPLLAVDGLAVPGSLHGISLTVRPGEIVGVTGLVGSGAETLADAVAGVTRHGGIVGIGGRTVRSARGFVAAGGAYVPSDRRRDGVLVRHSVRENLSLASLGGITRLGALTSGRADRRVAAAQIDRLGIRPANPEAIVGTLSGGNQQKVVLGRWLAAGSRLFVLDSPTAGVDIGSRAQIYGQINALVDAGAGVLLVTLDLEELAGLADRTIVLYRGEIRAELPRRDATGDRVLALASGASRDVDPYQAAGTAAGALSGGTSGSARTSTTQPRGQGPV